MKSCYNCGRDLHYQCLGILQGPIDVCCCTVIPPPETKLDTPSTSISVPSSTPRKNRKPQKRGIPRKTEVKPTKTTNRKVVRENKAVTENKEKLPREQKDPVSTGRKAAERIIGKDKDQFCEWRFLRYAGGGVNPVIGCIDGKQTNLHHGPDKNTMNNDRGNVHRICAMCHSRWHEANNDYYYPVILETHIDNITGRRRQYDFSYDSVVVGYKKHNSLAVATQEELTTENNARAIQIMLTDGEHSEEEKLSLIQG